ncbi:MAG: NAD-dependent epimerase/dehydratase family protein [Actinomycetota bacterium]|nr:NAD-dependent epimerase/dehydratase family protein [Actinomycetota bacterium]
MARTILITGGAGFIGSHLVDQLLETGDEVRVLDSLVGQVHGDTQRPEYLSEEAELIVGDVRDAEAISRALAGVDAVVHLAARVGVGQSMYEISDYVAENTYGTGVLLQALLDHPVERLVVASSMSIYGEGAYALEDGTIAPPLERSPEQLARSEWEPRGPGGETLAAVPTPEAKPPSLASVYAVTKYDQERLCLLYGTAYGVPTTALRFFNVYGPRQALSNPYTGVLAIFASRLLNERRPLVFEDGAQRRDFVAVQDVARACRLALERSEAAGHAINVGSGEGISILGLAHELARLLDKEIEPEVTEKYRVGDIRHCFADTSLAHEQLGFEAQVGRPDGLATWADWAAGQSPTDRVEAATQELTSRGLTR